MGGSAAGVVPVMTPLIFTVILLTAMASTFVQFVTGFGYAIVMVALLPMVMPVGDAVLLTLITAVLTSVWLIWDCRREIKLRYVGIPSAFSGAGAVGGLFLMGFVAPSLYLRILGVLLVLLAIWFLRFAAKASIRPTPRNGAIAGAIGGTCGALFAIGGPPLVLYYNSALDDKRAYMGSLQTVMIVQGIVAIGGRYALGMWVPGLGGYLIPCAVGMVLGAIPGRLLFGRIDSAKLKKIIYIFMCAAGIYIALTA